jgi:hypothetical protein
MNAIPGIAESDTRWECALDGRLQARVVHGDGVVDHGVLVPVDPAGEDPDQKRERGARAVSSPMPGGGYWKMRT